MSVVTFGLGTNQPLAHGLAVSYGDVIIVIPDEIPEGFEAPTEPLIIVQENTYQGITLHLSDDWAQFLSAISAQVLFTMKRHIYDETPVFEVTGTLDVPNAEVRFNLLSSETDTPVSEEYKWQMIAHRLEPDFIRVIIQGRLEVKPILRRIN